MDDDWPTPHWSQPDDPNPPPPTLGGIVFLFGGISLMGALLLFIGFVDDDGEALFWGSCLLLPVLVMISKTLQKVVWVVLKIVPNPMSREALLGEPNEAPSRSPLPLQMSGRGSRLDRYESVMFRLRLAPSEGQTAASLVAQHKRWFNGGENAARSFFNHPQVVKALDLGGANRTSSGQTKASSTTQNSGKPTADLVNDSFWGNLDQKAAKSVPAADGVCGMAHCSNEVNAFSFQCFKCRRRICSSCGNNGVLCHTCAS